MLEEKSWDEFRETGLILFINQILHVFGWAITCEIKDDKVVRVCPARCKFRGFTGDCVSDSYIKISKWMKEHGEELLKEAEE